MATIKHIKTPDGVTHDIGGGGGGSTTYTLTKSGNTITLTGSGGDTSSVIDANTTYSISISGHTLTLTPSSGTAQTVTVPDDNTTYTISVSGSTITLTPSSGSAQTITIPDATTSSSGVMSASDKSKLNGIASGAEVNVQSDWNQSDSTADDYIKNKPSIPTVNNATLTIQKNGTTIETFTANSSTNKTANITVPTLTSDLTNDSNFVSDANYVHTDNNFTNADVTKLNGIESGAEVNVQADWTQNTATADDYIKNKPALSTVATTGDYDDLSNKPTIPTVNDATLTIQKNGSTIDTFTANSSTNKTVNVTIPTTTSDLTNNSNFVSDASYVHTDNNFTNADVTKLNGIETGAEVNVQADWNQADSTADDYIQNKPVIPTVSVTQKTSIGTNIADITVNGTTTQLFAPSGGGGAIEYTLSGSGDDDEYTITATPTSGTPTSATIPAANQTDAGVMTATDKTKLDGIASGAEVNVQANWNEADTTSDSYIQNKPTLISFDDIYPVGSIYMSVNNTNPGTLFGGTWTQIEDTFLLAAGSTYTAGDTGGEATHQLQANELPKIDGYFEMRRWGSGQGVTAVSGMFTGRGYASTGSVNPFTAQSSGAATPQRITTSFGGNGAHNNMPPYLVVYVWQRTA